MGKAAKVRQTIVTRYTPAEKLPPDGARRYAIFSGKVNGKTYRHAMGVAICYHGWADEPPAWLIDGLTALEAAECRIDYWYDLEPRW